ncbi:MAG: hypothetical protein R6V53_00450 [Candidatus Woesearchaeota archaeon]
MPYIRFSLVFVLAHTLCYVLAGVLDLQLAKKIYSGKDRLFKSLRDMNDPEESRRIARLLVPSQVARGLLMSIVLYPILPYLLELSFLTRFIFISSLMFIYTDFSSAVPFSNTIEGIVYLKKEFVQKKVFWTIQLEAIMYSLMFGFIVAFFIV